MDSAPFVARPSPILRIQTEPGDSLLTMTIVNPGRYVEFRASSVTDGESGNGTALTSICSDASLPISRIRPLDSTFEGFVLCRLMASESDDAKE